MIEPKKTSSRMTPEIATRYQRTLELFEQSEAGRKRTYFPPMPFEVRGDAPGGGDVVELAYHCAITTPDRY
ncbi:hypothetical protein MJO47_04435 [Desulfuromonas sp. KJ2020]|uniref:hypothetical protein n=1 Tax=Desulfuromonas sp. KJ2020 TaxID=2919173 RepID=UPI0020A7E390|nr:hypothetical protein [Desulfuromonas sp. KJ2020]MCP3176341.1 hypothetical protein [Desulfuromonas sp. KJ2020]